MKISNKLHTSLRPRQSITPNSCLMLFASLQMFRYARAPQVSVTLLVTYLPTHIYPQHDQHMVPENVCYFHPRFWAPINVTQEKTDWFRCVSQQIVYCCIYITCLRTIFLLENILLIIQFSLVPCLLRVSTTKKTVILTKEN